MFICFVCGTGYFSIKALESHLKLLHPAQCLTGLVCKQPGCCQIFDSFKAFNKHLAKHEPYVIPPVAGQAPLAPDEHVDFVEPMQADVNMPNVELVEQNENIQPDINLFTTAVTSAAVAFIGKLYSKPNINRENVQDIIMLSSEFLSSGYLSFLESKVMALLEDVDGQDERKNDIKNMFKVLVSPFLGLETEHKRFKAFQESGDLVRPESYVIGTVHETVMVNNQPVIQPVNAEGQFVSIKSSLKSFFSLPGVLNSTLQYMDSLTVENDVVSNVVQGNLWQDVLRPKFCGKTVLPLNLYFDDFEPDNPIGSHAGDHSIGALYFNIPVIPPEHQSLLCNFFIAALFLSDDRKLGNESTFYPVVRELRDLEEHGLHVQTDDGDVHLYFCLCHILGDNLGMHSVLGFVESFSSNHLCIICKGHRRILSRQCRADPLLFRTAESYEIDLEINDVSSTGIKEKCVWHEVPSYHAITNASCDIMHDMLEGVCKYDMCRILSYFVEDRSFFTLETLIGRVNDFDYGPENGNRPQASKITRERLLHDNLIFSASEMLCFVRCFGEMVGDLIPEGDKVWEVYLLLRQILDIVLAPTFVKGTEMLLLTLIEEHHELYLQLFSDGLKPKHHFMVHYPYLMLSIGPLVNCWSMRFEAKHRELKQATRAMQSRRNLPFTLILHHQLKVCQRLMSRIGFEYFLSHGPSLLQPFQSVHHFHVMENRTNLGEHELCNFVPWVSVLGIQYKVGMVVVMEINENFPCFGRIQDIFLDESRSVYLVVRIWDVVLFNEHIHAYEVTERYSWRAIKLNELFSHMTLHVRCNMNGKMYVSTRHSI